MIRMAIVEDEKIYVDKLMEYIQKLQDENGYQIEVKWFRDGYVCIYLYVLRTYYRTGFVLLRNCIYTCRIYRFTGMAALYLSSKMEPAVSGRKPYPACDYLYWNALGCFLSGSCTFDKRIFTGTLCMGTYLNRCAGNYDIRFQQHQFSGCRPAF